MDLKKFFPQLNYTLWPIQEDTIKSIIDGNNTLCIMPTGRGKSLIYWLSGIELGGISLVISPLTALISEQAENLRSHGYNVIEFHGDISALKQMSLLKQIARGEITPDFIFASPEKIATDGFFEYCIKCRRTDLKLVVIDEVHCVSQWGISFRPFYKRIPDFLSRVFEDDWCTILALTATLNPHELRDICTEFRISSNNIIKETFLTRSEIQLHVHEFINEQEKEDKFWDIVRIHKDEKTLVYVYRKFTERGVEELCNKAIEKGYSAAFFHGDMSREERMDIISKYKNNEINIIFATNAFGMGINITDIRVVIHFMIPESAEQYYQEIGRAARDGNGANAYLLYTNKNIEVKKRHFIDRSFPDSDKLLRVYKKIAKKTGSIVYQYFDDEEVQDCLPYYLDAGLVEIECKAFPDLTGLNEIHSALIQQYYDSTKNKAFMRTVKRCEITPQQLSEDIYAAFVNDQISLSKALGRWLVINVIDETINDDALNQMVSSIEEKRTYKHELLDYFTYVLKNTYDSKQLHQEIAIYLGMDKHHAARIFVTDDGTNVRSKSEVIISNALYHAGINYQYEQKLYYTDTKWIEPDFTVHTPSGKTLYWEHVGMLGMEDYDNRWLQKLDIYDSYFPNQLIKTYESGTISQDTQELIRKILSL